MARKSGLGKGLDALIPPSESALSAGSVKQVPVINITPNPLQPRTIFAEEEIADLAASILEHGVIQPLVVTHAENPGKYVLIAGERRLQACQQANLEQVPVIIREASGQQLLELALVENLQRTDLSPLEAAGAYKELSNSFNLSHEEIAAKVGKSRVSITNTLGLLSLSIAVKKALAEAEISEGHARALKPLSSQSQSAVLQTIIKRGLNVRQTEDLIRKLKGKKTPSKPKAKPSPEILELENRLRESLGTKIGLSHSPKGGKIVIHYYSDEELNALVDRLLGDTG
ncbi:MAG: ParB/RepB/Spo0J family partition protein [Chloroflexi bacterium]|nr:ParB/RepB/Spo0J family partition protein [Chloroflexota bacterium]